jgi:integrase/recombinase XerC
MTVQVEQADGSYRVAGGWDGAEAANAFLAHLSARAFSPATIRAYAFDLVNFARYLMGQGVGLAAVSPADVFAWVDWQGARHGGTGTVVALRPRHAAASTVNRRVAAVRALFEYMVMTGARPDNPMPSPRRGQGLRPAGRGLLGHLGPGRPRGGGMLVRQPRRLPESLAAGDVDVFVASLRTHRDRAMVLAMLLGGLRSAEVRGLKLAAYLRLERPPRLATPECFVVLRGPTTGAPVTEAGLRSLFRRHRAMSGAVRVRPHRLRHTYGTELAAAGMDLLALRELMGHSSPETTAAYVHLPIEQLAAEYGAARAALARSTR